MIGLRAMAAPEAGMGEVYAPREMLAKLVAFPTVSRDGNLALIDFVRAYLAGHGVESRLVPNPEGTKASLYALVGPSVPGGVVLSGHSDVVPVDGQRWTSDPWSLTERDGRLYGRGACDMKGFVALSLALVPRMLRAGLTRPVQIALSYDEELGCLAAPEMIAAMRETLPPAAAVFVGEPTSMQVVTAHKACVGLETVVTGHEVHSSILHRGVSAVMTAARLVQWHAERTAENAAAPEPDSDFDPPYTTLHVGTIAGGTAGNITAAHCRFQTDFRVMPTEDPGAWIDRYIAHAAQVSAEIAARHPAAGVRVDIRQRTPGVAPEQGGAAETLARALTGDNARRAVSYATEAGQFQEQGYSTVVVGPGDIAQAHQPDEYLAVSQFEAGEAFLRRLIDRLAA
jgi:acetylornithine deacetylase